MEIKIGDNIRALRKLCKLTQAQLADKIAMSQNGYSKIESNDTDVSFSRLAKIAEVLGVSISELVYFNKDNTTHITSPTQHQPTTFFDNLQNPIEDIKNIFMLQINTLRQDLEYYRNLVERLLIKS